MGRWEGKQTELDQKVIGCAIEVHRTLGPGFIENIYRNALQMELTRQGVRSEREKEIVISYKVAHVGTHRLDLVVEDWLILELKAIQALAADHYAQLRSYLKAIGAPYGFLMNFGRARGDVRRVEPVR